MGKRCCVPYSNRRERFLLEDGNKLKVQYGGIQLPLYKSPDQGG